MHILSIAHQLLEADTACMVLADAKLHSYIYWRNVLLNQEWYFQHLIIEVLLQVCNWLQLHTGLHLFQLIFC